ncbi:glycosyltransferase family 4 protein [Candidatus Woesearchaeota archaeon]|nr:glycosyltransferase family 4 protein [Candidatus Woesearchaeota archaeon]
MKILVINDSCKEIGGAETYIFGIVKLLRNEGHDLYLFSYDSESRKDEHSLILKHTKKRSKFLFHRFIFNPIVYRELKQYVKEINPDIIHMHNNYAYSVSVLLALRKFDIPVIHHVHDWGLICPTSWSVYKKNLQVCRSVEGIQIKCLTSGCLPLHHWALTCFRNKMRIKLERENINLFISPSIRLRDYLKEHNLVPAIWLPHFIEFENIKVKIPKQDTILYVGVLSVNKGVEYLIKSFPLIKEKMKNAKLHIVGDGPERNKLEQLSRELNIENDVKFFGKIPHDKVIEAYGEAKILVMPSIWMENSPFVLYEAMSAGKPVVASNRGGIVDLVRNGVNGAIVEPANPEEIAKNVIKILKDKNLLKQYSLKSQKIIQEEFTTEKHLKYLNNIYKDLLSNRGKNESLTY